MLRDALKTMTIKGNCKPYKEVYEIWSRLIECSTYSTKKMLKTIFLNYRYITLHDIHPSLFDIIKFENSWINLFLDHARIW